MSQGKLILSIVVLCFASWCVMHGQTMTPFPYLSSYTMQISLVGNEIKGKQKIRYVNNSDVSLDTIYFNLFTNAFSSKISPYANQQLRLRSIDFQYATEDEMGGYSLFTVKDHNIIYVDEAHEMAFIKLNNALNPKGVIDLEVEFALKLPKLFDRIGIKDGHTYLTNWYPEIAVYDINGWHAMPYLSMGEFYHDFADFNVELDCDRNINLASGGDIVTNHGSTKTQYHITQKNVTNLALFASPYLGKEHPLSIEGKEINLHLFCDTINQNWAKAQDIVKSILIEYSKIIGEFPYDKLTIVQGNASLSSGMEYPGIVVINSYKNEHLLQYYLAHEIAHQYFYAALSSDERTEAYFDEGLATWIERKYTMKHEGVEHYTSMLPNFLKSTDDVPFLNKVYLFQRQRNFYQPLNTPCQNLGVLNYGLNNYPAAAQIWRGVEEYIGEDEFQKILKAYYTLRKNSHVSTNDFIGFLSAKSGKNLSYIFESIKGLTPDYKLTKFDKNADGSADITIVNEKNAAPFQLALIKEGKLISKSWMEGFTGEKMVHCPELDLDEVLLDPHYYTLDEHRDDNQIRAGFLGKTEKLRLKFPFGIDDYNRSNVNISPLLGYNFNDGLMIGGAVFNSTFPAKNTKVMVAPLYTFDSKEMVGQAWIKHNLMISSDAIRKFQISSGIKSYHFFTNDVIGYKLRYFKFDPTISIHFKSQPTSTSYQKLALSWIYLREDYADFSQGDPQRPNIIQNNNSVMRLRYDHFDFNVLSPKESWVEADFMSYATGLGEERFLKLTAARKNTWRYSKHKNIQLRLWASAFLLNTQRDANTFSNELARGSIALIYQGYNDYAYDEYYFNRTNQAGALRNQISEKGGGFKNAPTNFYNIGMSNNWAASANITMDIPIKSKFLKPLQLYFDAGMYSQEKKSKLFYSGGLSLNILDGVFKVFLPLINHEELTSIYDQEKRSFFSRVSFSIDLAKYNPWDIIDDFNY